MGCQNKRTMDYESLGYEISTLIYSINQPNSVKKIINYAAEIKSQAHATKTTDLAWKILTG